MSIIYVRDYYVRLHEMYYEEYSYVGTPEPWLYYDRLIKRFNV